MVLPGDRRHPELAAPYGRVLVAAGGGGRPGLGGLGRLGISHQSQCQGAAGAGHGPSLVTHGQQKAGEPPLRAPQRVRDGARGCDRCQVTDTDTLRGGGSPAVPSGTGTGNTGVLYSSHHFVLSLPSRRVTDPAEESPAMSCSPQGQARSRHPTTQLQRGWEPGAELKWAPGLWMGVPGGAGWGCGCSGEGSARPAQL